MTNLELVAKAKDIVNNYKTLYVMGCIGSPLNDANKTRYRQNHSFNRQAHRQKKIASATADTFGFDCVCLIKSILWGWNGDTSKTYGGAKYRSNNVDDIGANAMINKCNDISTDFSKIEIGEAVWMKGHIGIYIGDGLAIECTPMWKDGVQITSCNCTKSGYNRRDWTKHGKLPYIEYIKEETTSFKIGDKVKLTNNAVIYGTNKRFASFVYKVKLYVREIKGSRVVVSIFKKGATTGAVDKKYLTKV